MTDDREWLQCRNCESWERFVFHNPDTVHCDECGAKVGSTDTAVDADVCTFQRQTNTIVGDSGAELARVEFDLERVRKKGETA